MQKKNHMRRKRAELRGRIEKKKNFMPMYNGYYFDYQPHSVIRGSSISTTNFEMCKTQYCALTVPMIVTGVEKRKKYNLRVPTLDSTARNKTGDLNSKRIICQPDQITAAEIIHQATNIPKSLLFDTKNLHIFDRQLYSKRIFKDCTRCVLLQTQLNISRRNWRQSRIDSVTNQAVFELREKFKMEKNRVICVPTLTTDVDKRKQNSLPKISSTSKYILSCHELSSCSRCIYLHTMLKIVQKYWSEKKCLDLLKQSQAELQNICN